MGDSDPVPETDTPSELVSALTRGLAEILGSNRYYHLAGFSFGGMIAGAIAYEERQRILSLALAAPIGLATGRSRPEVVGLGNLVGDERRATHRSNLVSMMFADPSSADGGPLRGLAEGQDIRWTEAGGFLRGSFDLPVADKALCLCFVSYASEFQYQWWLVDPSLILNPRRAIHACFDPSLDFLRDLVLEERNRKGPARTFEDGIAYLLHMLGFRVKHFKAPLDDAPDIVGCADSHDVLVVECTRDRLNSGGKLAKLKVRTSQIRRALMEADLPNARIIPVIVTALPQSDILEEAAPPEAQDVVVVTLDDLRSLIHETRFNPDPHRAIFERAAATYKKTPG